MSDGTADLEARLGYRFQTPRHLEVALTHASLAPERLVPGGGNQRLEFLGDAVLNLILAEYFYNAHPDEREGVLAKRRASLACGSSLVRIARELTLDAQLEVSAAEAENNPQRSDAMLEDALEALFGAIYLDGGLEAAREVILRLIAPLLEEHAAWDEGTANPKGALQEYAQRTSGGALPTYTVVATHGPDHDRRYTVQVQLGSLSAEGVGSSRKIAEIAAARAALGMVAE